MRGTESTRAFAARGSGFTMVEAVISMAVVSLTVFAALEGSKFLRQGAAESSVVTTHSMLRAAVYGALADVRNTGKTIFNTKGEVIHLKDFEVPGGRVPVDVRGADGESLVDPGSGVALGEESAAKYKLELGHMSWGWVDPATGEAMRAKHVFGFAQEREKGSTTFPAKLYVRAEPSAHSKNQIPIESSVPIVLKFNKETDELTAAYVNPDDLAANQFLIAGGNKSLAGHTEQDCYTIGGMPYPVPRGWVCRVPNMEPTRIGYVRCPAGWVTYSNKLNKDGTPIPMTATEPNIWFGRDCDGKQTQCMTGWHQLASAEIETCSRRIPEGTKDAFNDGMFAGGMVISLGLSGFGTNPGVMLAGAGISYLAGKWFGKKDCDTEDISDAAKVVAIACF